MALRRSRRRDAVDRRAAVAARCRRLRALRHGVRVVRGHRSSAGQPVRRPLDAESEERFVAERASRFLVGLTLVAAGTALVGVSYIAWFGLTVAGGEIAYKSYSSRFARDGKADRVWRLDSIRQVVSVALACVYLLGRPPDAARRQRPYVAPYYVILVLAGLAARGHRPQLPGPPRLTLALGGEMLGTALYLQGDVLLLGFLTDSTTAGYYTLCWTVAAALAAVGQSFGMTYHEPLRLSGGKLESGPPLRLTLAIGGLSSARPSSRSSVWCCCSRRRPRNWRR